MTVSQPGQSYCSPEPLKSYYRWQPLVGQAQIAEQHLACSWPAGPSSDVGSATAAAHPVNGNLINCGVFPTDCTNLARSAAQGLTHAAGAAGAAQTAGTTVTAGTASAAGAAITNQQRTIAARTAVASRIAAGAAGIPDPARTAVAAVAERADIGEVRADAPAVTAVAGGQIGSAITADTADAAVTHDLAADAAVTTVGAEPAAAAVTTVTDQPGAAAVTTGHAGIRGGV